MGSVSMTFYSISMFNIYKEIKNHFPLCDVTYAQFLYTIANVAVSINNVKKEMIIPI